LIDFDDKLTSPRLFSYLEIVLTCVRRRIPKDITFFRCS